MSDEERELTGGEIQRFVELQAAEGKTAGGSARSPAQGCWRQDARVQE